MMMSGPKPLPVSRGTVTSWLRIGSTVPWSRNADGAGGCAAGATVSVVSPMDATAAARQTGPIPSERLMLESIDAAEAEMDGYWAQKKRSIRASSWTTGAGGSDAR